MHSMLSLQPRNNLHKRNPKVRTNMLNEDKYVKVKQQSTLNFKNRMRQGTVRVKSMIEEKSARKDSKSYSISLS